MVNYPIFSLNYHILYFWMYFQYFSFLQKYPNNLSKRVTFCNFWNSGSRINYCFWFLELFSMIYQAHSVRSSILTPPQGKGDHNLEQTLHVLFDVWGNPQDTGEIPGIGTWELRWHSFIVIDRHRHLFFCVFFTSSESCSPGCFFLDNLPLCLTYFLSIVLYCFIINICLKWKVPGERPPGEHSEVISMFSLVEKFFCVLLRFWVAKGQAYWNLGY